MLGYIGGVVTVPTSKGETRNGFENIKSAFPSLSDYLCLNSHGLDNYGRCGIRPGASAKLVFRNDESYAQEGRHTAPGSRFRRSYGQGRAVHRSHLPTGPG